MRILLDQIYAAVNAGHFYLSLFPALTLPDICSAMESDDGWASRAKYVAWFDRWAARKFMHPATEGSAFNGEDCYYLRCSLLHQGAAQHPKSRYSRVFFCEPNENHRVAHMNIIGDTLNLDVSLFCVGILHSTVAWLADVELSGNYQRNYPRFLQRYPDGFGGIKGIPMIA